MCYWKGFHDHMILWNVGITLNSGIIFQVENGVCIITSWYTGTGVSPEIQGIPRIQMSRAHHWGKYLGEPSRDLSPREYSQRVCMCKQAGVLSRVRARSMDKFLHPGHVRPCKWLLFRSGWPGRAWLKNVSNIYAASGAITIINEFPRSCGPETIIPRIKPFVRWGGALASNRTKRCFSAKRGWAMPLPGRQRKRARKEALPAPAWRDLHATHAHVNCFANLFHACVENPSGQKAILKPLARYEYVICLSWL